MNGPQELQPSHILRLTPRVVGIMMAALIGASLLAGCGSEVPVPKIPAPITTGKVQTNQISGHENCQPAGTTKEGKTLFACDPVLTDAQVAALVAKTSNCSPNPPPSNRTTYRIKSGGETPYNVCTDKLRDKYPAGVPFSLVDKCAKAMCVGSVGSYFHIGELVRADIGPFVELEPNQKIVPPDVLAKKYAAFYPSDIVNNEDIYVPLGPGDVFPEGMILLLPDLSVYGPKK